MNSTKFAVRQFKNRNWVSSYRVDGYIHGISIRKNFKTRDQAIAEKGALDLRAIQADAGLRTATTFLGPEQLREFEAAGLSPPLAIFQLTGLHLNYVSLRIQKCLIYSQIGNLVSYTIHEL